MKRRRTPQEKKQLSLAKDCRSIYGNNDKAARKAIPRRRAWRHRAYRHAVRQAIASQLGALAERPAAIDDETGAIRLGPWRKWSDAPLGIVLKRK